MSVPSTTTTTTTTTTTHELFGPDSLTRRLTTRPTCTRKPAAAQKQTSRQHLPTKQRAATRHNKKTALHPSIHDPHPKPRAPPQSHKPPPPPISSSTPPTARTLYKHASIAFLTAPSLAPVTPSWISPSLNTLNDGILVTPSSCARSSHSSTS